MVTTSNKRHISGIVLLDKTEGISSNAALQKVKNLFHATKAGHVGTLDPLATGMLPICLGEATKFSGFLIESTKCYEVLACLGSRTTTGDREGEIVESCTVDTTLTQIQQILPKFIGIIQQIPPMYSALKHQGKALYHLARAGIEVERPARWITINKIDLLDYTKPHLKLSVVCSKGTYIRTLVEDIAQALGNLAYVLELRRLYVGNYTTEKMMTLSHLKELKETDNNLLDEQLLPIHTMLKEMPFFQCTQPEMQKLYYGQNLKLKEQLPSGSIQLLTPNQHFFGVGEVLENQILVPRRLLKKELSD